MDTPENLPKHVGWIDVDVIPEFPSSLDNPYVVQHQANLDNVGDDPESVGFIEIFNTPGQNQVEVKTWNGSWKGNFYLPSGNDVPTGSKMQLTCNSGYSVKVYYPNPVTGAWRMREASNGETQVVPENSGQSRKHELFKLIKN